MIRYQRAVERVLLELAKPDMEFDSPSDDEFDPWALFPAVYGSYSSDFDDMAIEVLEGIAAMPRCWDRDDLGAQMFREMLCKSDLCDYGTSPRVCFPTPEFEAVLGDLVSRWKTFRERSEESEQ